MKLMTYNIFDGGQERLPFILEAVKKESPDYLTINEANGFNVDDEKILREFAEKVNLPHYDISLSGEYDYHVAVFSKYPFKKVQKLKSLMRACLVVELETELGEISIASFHLTPYTEDLRLPEIDLVLKSQTGIKNSILMGDMNSLSKADQYDSSIIKDFNDTQIKKYTTDGNLRFDVTEKILSAGYHDCALELKRNKDNTVPTLLNEDSAHGHMRLDYIFLSKSLLPCLGKYRVIKNELTDKASDHYPVTVEVK